MADHEWGSPAVREALDAAALHGVVDVVALAEALTARPDLGASRVVGRLGLSTADFGGWLRSTARARHSVTVEDLIEVHEAVEGRGGPPATTGGVLGALLMAADHVAGGFAHLAREEFDLRPAALRQAVRAVGPAALAELATVVAPLTVGMAGPAPVRVRPEVLLPYSIGLEAILERAVVTARRKGEDDVSSGVLMSAVHALAMTADWARCLLGMGLSPQLVGAETARSEAEGGRCVVRLVGSVQEEQTPVSGLVADILVAALAMAAAAQDETVVSTHALVLAQLVTAESRLSSLAWPLMGPRISPVELYPRYVNGAGVSPEQLATAEATYRRARPAGMGPLDDYTDDLAIRALWDAGHMAGDDLAASVARLGDVLHPSQARIVDRAMRSLARKAATTGLSRYFDTTGSLQLAREAFSAALDSLAPDEAVDDWLSVRAVLVDGDPPDGADPSGLSGARAAAEALRGEGPSGPAMAALLTAKRRLLHGQATAEPGALEWAADAGMPLAEAAVCCGVVGAWTDAAELVVTEARVLAQGPAAVYRRRPMPVPSVALAGFDADACDEEFVAVALDPTGGVLAHRRADGSWTGRSLSADRGAAHARWLRRWRRALKVGWVADQLGELLELIGLDPDELASPVVHLATAGMARGLPVAQAMTVATGGRVRVLHHLLGGMPPDHGEPPVSFAASGEVCLVREPPGPGGALPFSAVESDAVESFTTPVASLGGRRATRSWVQRAITALAGVPAPQALHFTGHGTVRAVPSGDTAAAILLADAELLTPGDLAVVEAGIRVLVCAACDLAVASMHGGEDLALAALRAGVGVALAAAWPVDDAVTTALVARAYSGWVAGSKTLMEAFHGAATWWREADVDDIVGFLGGLAGSGPLAENLAHRLASPAGELRGGEFWGSFGAYVP